MSETPQPATELARTEHVSNVLAQVNAALTRAGSRHLVGTRDGKIEACTVEEAMLSAPVAPLPDSELAEREALVCALIALSKNSREHARKLLRRADGQGNTHYAARLAAEAEGVESVLDKLAALLAVQR